MSKCNWRRLPLLNLLKSTTSTYYLFTVFSVNLFCVFQNLLYTINKKGVIEIPFSGSGQVSNFPERPCWEATSWAQGWTGAMPGSGYSWPALHSPLPSWLQVQYTIWIILLYCISIRIIIIFVLYLDQRCGASSMLYHYLQQQQQGPLIYLNWYSSNFQQLFPNYIV